MKKTLSIIASCFLLVFCFAFVSCGTSKLQGTYKLYQVVTVENGEMTVADGTDYKVDGKEFVYKFNKDGSGKLTTTTTTEEGVLTKETSLSWKLDGLNLKIKFGESADNTTSASEAPETETEEACDIVGYFNDGMLVYTLSQTEDTTVLLVFKKQTFKISSLFAKTEKAKTEEPAAEAPAEEEPAAEAPAEEVGE